MPMMKWGWSASPSTPRASAWAVPRRRTSPWRTPGSPQAPGDPSPGPELPGCGPRLHQQLLHQAPGSQGRAQLVDGS
ncbi:hypothetical protein QJS66_11625 [Kocuria rhizophila]|nr:hypothetical protein QJS66_11625 [Kocuria rhizophila]